MNVARTGHTATWLPNAAGGGYVLVAGGRTSGGLVLSSAELYDPVANTWTLLPSPLVVAVSGAPAAALPGSAVLLSGGSSNSATVADMQLFDLASQQFSFAGALPMARKGHAAAALHDGRVLLAGGTDANGNTLGDTAIYDPAAGTVEAGPGLNTPRANATATTLLDGTVLIAGGCYPEGAAANGNIAELNSAEIFDPVAGTISPAPATLTQARAGHLAFLLPNNNQVLLVGGSYNGADLAASELYTPWLAKFSATGSMSVSRSAAVGAPIFQSYGANNVPLAGQLLVSGGSSQGIAQNGAELYGFATISTDQSDYAPGTPVIMTGTGWQPGETVSLYMKADPSTANVSPVLTPTADDQGYFVVGTWAPDLTDLNARFYLTAVGASGGSQAQTTFTDGNATITGTVTDSSTGNPMNGASVTCASGCTSTPATTSTQGTYSLHVTFQGSGPVNITITASATGHTSQTSASFSTSSPSGHNFALAPAITASSTSVSSSLSSSTYGALVTFTATVSPSGASGNVSFYDAASGAACGALGISTQIGLTQSLSGGQASMSATTLSVGTHTVLACYAGNSSYSASGGSVSQVVNQATPTITTAPTASAISYGQTLASSNLTGGAGSVAGSFAFTNPATAPGVGTNSQSVTFTPTDTTDYGSVSTTVSVTVGKATPTITTAPTASAISYGQTLASSNLTGGAGSVAGSFAFTNPSMAPGAGTNSQGVTFTPTDTIDYTTATTTVILTVNKVALTVKANDASRNFNAPNPSFTALITGFVNGDTAAGAVSGAPSLTTAATLTSAPGNYTISAGLGTLSAVNYSFNFVDGTLTILATTPDLVEVTPAVTGSLTAGSSALITDTLLNQGGATAGGSTTYYYLSSNGTTKGSLLAGRYVASVAGGSGSVGSTPITLPVSLNGTYYVIACADVYNQVVEGTETNNCTTSDPFTIAGADLNETSVSVPTTNPIVAGGSVVINDTVVNQGSGSAGSSTTLFYLSIDGSAKGTNIGSRSVGTLAASGPSSVSTTITLPLNLNGNYYVIACADYYNTVAETDDTNNCNVSGQFTVTGADLKQMSVSVSTGSSIYSGGSLTITDTVQNVGDGKAGSSTTFFYLSTDGVTKGANIGSRYVGTMLGAAVSTGSATLTLPLNLKGSYFVIACADKYNVVAESDETNNCQVSPQFAVPPANLIESSVTVPSLAN